MKRSIVAAGAGALALAGSVLAAPVAHAEERVCRGTLGAVTVDNVRVPVGASCTLNRTTVKGTVKVESNARLSTSSARVNGNVQAEGHAHVYLYASTVGGSVQLKQGRTASLRSNQVKGDVQSFTNRGAQDFTANRIDGNLQCKSNVPAPTGSGNVVGGTKEDQCRRL
ncbi:hypothetical protein Kfla_4429 [Kribbella flavida DSM 17836]|uniref:Adhesin domain-containing protein n=1 Tax=Kribbella flavida (strain DSM 17836 / JCM 10339 / NBRC 14399) TaxID=479435 RepID=D2PWJ1_KRIFD|nr:hypothetical protein [Kribbella flavida]ADB33460.1 hypothetical protein Kfla_4429 [Kribbella flavida DSM 17836]